MTQTDPTRYTDVSKEDWDRFKTAAKARGMNISGNTDDVVFDLISVHVDYKEDAKTLQFIVHEPFWLAPGVVVGALHALVAGAMNVQEVPRQNENPTITHDHTERKASNHADIHPAHVTRSTHAPHAAAHK